MASKRGKSKVTLHGLPIKTSESLSSLSSPAAQKSYGYKRSAGDPRSASDNLASAPVSMTPKRQVRASGSPAAASDSNPARQVALPPRIRRA